MEKQSELKRSLNTLDVFCISTGAMISSGLFILPGLAHAMAGPAVVISYFIAGILASTGMLCQAELVSAMPKAGGDYFYVTRSMGPLLGTIDGILTWLSISLKSSFALIGMAAFTALITDINIKIIALVLCVIFVSINVIGIKEAGRLQVAIVIVLIGTLLVYSVKGIGAVSMANFSNFAPNGMGAIFSAAAFVFVSYGGLLKVTSVAEEVKDPAVTIPKAMILSLIFVCVMYTIVVFVTSGVLGSDSLDKSLTPISDGAYVFMGGAGKLIMGLGAVMAFVSTANAGIMAASRYPLALSRDRLIPDIFGKLNKRSKTPYISILSTGIVILLAVFLDLSMLVKVASTVFIFTFIFSCFCVIVMRESGVQNYQPTFKAPFYPWLQVAGVFGFWVLVISMGEETLLLGSLLLIAGFGVYWFYGRLRGKKDFALLHLIERVASREFIDLSLETELREIIRERDNISKDRFDHIVESCDVIDMEEEMTSDAFFTIVSKKLSTSLNLPANRVLNLILDREEESSTVLSPGIAIPHIVVSGSGLFVMIMARSRDGIIFPGNDKKVHMVFVIAGTKDERNFHLIALSAIAQIVQSPDFEKKWIAAKNIDALRDLVLLGERKRR